VTVLRYLSVALLCVFWLVLRGWAHAHDRDRRPLGDSQLVRLEARVTFNEGLDNVDSLYVLHQIIEGWGGTPAERARALASHSRCVAGNWTQDRAATERPGGNCRWTRNLAPDGRLPRGWPHSQQAWHRLRPRWLAHLDRVRALVGGVDTYRPCMFTPTTWDGARWQARARARGWEPVICEGASPNLGYVRRSQDTRARPQRVRPRSLEARSARRTAESS